jgi:PAS domain S-box-containing protein
MKIKLDLMTRIRTAYLSGIGLLIVMIASAYVLVDSRMQNHEDDASLMNTVAEQRMWSQRILLLTTHLAHPDTEEGIADSRARLGEAIAAMHYKYELIQDALQQPAVQSTYPDVYRIYFTDSTPLTLQQQHYLVEVKRIAELDDYQKIARELVPGGALRQQARELLERYQTVVDLMVQSSRKRVQDLQQLHDLLSLATVLLALALVIWLFRPMEKLIHSEREKLRNLNSNLEQLAQQRNDEFMRSELRAQSILNTVLDGIVTIDHAGRIQSFNPAAEKLFGYNAAEVVGRNVNILMPEPYHSEHDGYLRHYADTGEAHIIGTGREVTGQRRNGSVFPMELAVNEIDKGNGRGYVGMVRDLSVRKAAEAQLQTVTATRQAILDSANVAIITTDTEGLITVFNVGAQRMLGYSQEEVVGKHTPAIIHVVQEVVARAKIVSQELGRTIEPGFEVFVAKTRTGLPDENEWTYVRKDGSMFPVLLSITAMFNANGVITGYLGIAYDMTEHKRMELMKREFISTVSHELRTPLTSIRGALGLVAGGATGTLPDKARELVTIASNNCDRLVRLINDILDMEKIESGKMVFAMQPLDLASMIQETIAANQPYARQHQASIVVEGELPSLVISGDRDRLIQVLTNLLSNAAKFSPKDGHIHVSLEQHDKHARLTVRDDGPGIPKEFQSRLFQKFSQADASDTRAKGGTGLGLSITKAIVERHGGHITYTSTAAQGTAFFVDLPLPVKIVASSDKIGPRILVVEDDPDIANLLRMMLEQEGYAADIACNTTAARNQLAIQNYAAITLDMLLPGESGIGFLSALRSQPETAHLPVIVVSAVAESSRKLAENAVVSVLDWLQKPIDEKRLLQAVARAVKHGPRQGQRVLHVEDDNDIASIVKTMLEGVAETDNVGTLEAARHALSQSDYALVILDIGLPDGSGLELLPLLDKFKPPLPVLVFSAQELDAEDRKHVTTSFVKSRTDEATLVQAIRATLESAVVEVNNTLPHAAPIIERGSL